VKVHDKECFGGGDFLAAFVFLAFDAAVASCEFGADGVGDVVDVHSIDFSNIGFNTILFLNGFGILEKDEAVPSFHVHPIQIKRSNLTSHPLLLLLLTTISPTSTTTHWITKHMLHITTKCTM